MGWHESRPMLDTIEGKSLKKMRRKKSGERGEGKEERRAFS